MSTYQSMLHSVTFRYNDAIKAACEQLFRYFQFNQFYYVHISNDGYLSSLDSHLIFAQYWAEAKGYTSYPFYRHPSHFNSSVQIIRQSDSPELSQLIDYTKDRFSFNSWLRIVNRTSDGFEEFGFSSPISCDAYCSYLMKEVPLFLLFIKWMKSTHNVIFSKLIDHRVNLVHLIGSDFNKNDVPHVEDSFGRKHLLQKLGINISSTLTTRDIEIIRLLLQGYSASKIASKIYLSRRTVEHNLERLKDKLMCDSKSELIQKSMALDQIGYL